MTKPPTVLTVLRRASDIIKARGWAAAWSDGEQSALNVRSAIARACTELVGDDGGHTWHVLYVETADVVSQHLREGIMYWEFTVKASSEVEAMLTEAANRLENNEIRPSPRLSRRSRNL